MRRLLKVINVLVYKDQHASHGYTTVIWISTKIFQFTYKNILQIKLASLMYSAEIEYERKKKRSNFIKNGKRNSHLSFFNDIYRNTKIDGGKQN